MATTADDALLRTLLRDLAGREVAAQAAVRVWRNFTAGLCVALVGLVPIFAWVAPHLGGSLVTIRQATAGVGPLPTNAPAKVLVTSRLSSGDLGAVELWGGLGGAVGVIAAIGRLRLSQRPSSLQVLQLVLKPLAGAAVALFGVVLLQASLVAQVQPVYSGAIAAYAALFGFAQEALTRLVDRRAGALLDAAAPRGDPTAPKETP